MTGGAGALLRIRPEDNVAVALRPIPAGEALDFGGGTVVAGSEIPMGHKLALMPISRGENIVKYGVPIAHATQDILPGAWVHTHNAATNLDRETEYAYEPDFKPLPKAEPMTFLGYRRRDGRAAVRNEIWILPLVGCVNSVAQRMAQANQALVSGGVEGLYAFTHPYGCSQLGDDHARTRKLLAALSRHPNAGGVLILGLGCENNAMADFQRELGDWDGDRVKFLVCQDVPDEQAAGAALLRQLAAFAGTFRREKISASELTVGLKCGGSDGLSGVTANPAVGAFSDLLIAQGGGAVLTEVPEMFGAETLLLNRCENEGVFRRAADMVDGYKAYYRAHGQPVYENPSPGNRAGGITTLEDKSCGCVQKGGTAPVSDVIGYGDMVRKRGLTLLAAPGNDLVSATALAAAGCHMILFTTGRGTPFGCPAPTLKIATNSALADRKGGWIDFDAGSVAAGEPIGGAGARLMELVLRTASGARARAEINGFREIAILKDGVVL